MNKFLFILLIFTSVFVHQSHAQKRKKYSKSKQMATREQLEKQRVSILEEIAKTQEQLTTLRASKQASLEELKTLQVKLNARQELINNINREVNILEHNIRIVNNDVNLLRTEMDTLKKQYAEMVRYTYKNRTSSDMIMFLFSASSFNDAVRRLQYAKQYRNFRAEQANRIISKSKSLSEKMNLLSVQKKKKDIVLNVQSLQTKTLEYETKQKDQLVVKLKGQEAQLLKNLATKTKSAEQLNRAIAIAIKREIELAQQRALKEQRLKEQNERIKKLKEQKLNDERLAKERELKRKQQQQEEAKKLAEAKRIQLEREKAANLEKEKRIAEEKKLAKEKKEREDQERKIALEQKRIKEAEEKAKKMADAQRKEKEAQLAIERKKQEEKLKSLQQERERQEDEAKKLLAQKQRQEEEQRNLREEKKRQEREQARLDSKDPYKNPRYVPSLNVKEETQVSNTVESKNTSPTSSNDDYKYALTPEERNLANNFESSKGRLPWPVEKGYIVEHFGKNKHPLFNIVTENYGIDIKTGKGAPVRAVFGGEVNSIITIPGMGQTVLINHGSFYTVYSKLSRVNVSKGSKVSLKQAIGSVMTDEDGNTQVHFEIWKVGTNGQAFKINPEQWVSQ
ncbi:MAG: peptidoglycan DD-metalloendopeptidase family protein [Chitinophagaceae bacterium]